MYSWKEIALMYKEEANRLCDEVHDVFGHLNVKVPHSVEKAEGILKIACIGSANQIDFIESFENKAENKADIRGGTLKRDKPRFSCGFHFSDRNWMEEGDYEEFKKMCSHIHDPKMFIYSVMDKCAVHCTIEYLKSKDYIVLDDNVEKNKDNVITVLDRITKREATIKVVASGMQFSGKTKRFGSDGETFEVSRQYTYLIDPKESIKSRYVFANFDAKEKSLRLYACIKGRHLHEMLVDPLRPRFVGKNACILQKEGYNSSKECPFSIDEIIRRS